MIYTKKRLSVFLIIFIQSLLALSVGLLMFFFMAQKTIAPNVFVADVNIGKLDKAEAVKKIEESFGEQIRSGSFDIKYAENKSFSIKYSDIDAKLDSSATIDKAYGKNFEIFKNLFYAYFTSKRNNVLPAITYNEGKLKEKLNELAVLVNRKPEDANIKLVDDKVVKKAEVYGLTLNIENADKKIQAAIATNWDNSIEFKPENNYEIETVTPEFTLSRFEGAEEVVSQYTTKITTPEYEDSIKTAVHAINRVMVPPADLKEGLEAATFSFNKYLNLENAILEHDNEGYNQVASTLNAAVLNLLDLKDITRTPHKFTVDYIEPGLDAIVLGNTYDYSFKNTFDSVLIVFAQVKEDKIIVSLVGEKKDKRVGIAIQTEIEQKFDPTIVNVENQSLKPGEQKMVSPGKKGVKVNVYLVTSKEGKEQDKKLLYYDKYDAVKAIIETGPNTAVIDDVTK